VQGVLASLPRGAPLPAAATARVAPPNDLADGTKPELDRIAAFRVPGDCAIKLHVGTWPAGPLFVHDECLFFNLENIDTNERDFDTSELPNEYQIQV
jgi:hypothetical protein